MPWFRRPKPAPPPDHEAALRSPVTTELDIRMCFRLLLGRDPNPEEWQGHAAHAGQPLPPVVAGYLGSLEFSRRGLLAPPPGTASQVADFPGFRIHADPSDLQIGRHVLAGNYEPEVTAVMEPLLRPGMAVIDIGANIGVFTMLAAAAVGPEGAVLAVEPNPDNARLLEASARLNGFHQVTTAQLAASDRLELLALNTTHSNGTTSAPGADVARILAARTVPAMPVDDLVRAAWPASRRVGLIKVDVEGAEYKALGGAAATIERDRPAIVSEFSPTFMPGISGVDGPTYLSWLTARGYALSVIRLDEPPLPCGTDTDAVMAAFAARGTDHIDLLALPA